MAADIEDPVFQMLVIVETVNTIVLGAGLYLMYSGIEMVTQFIQSFYVIFS